MKKNNKYDFSKEEYLNILDRIISFINNCDNKSSIILGVFGILFTIFFTNSGFSILISIISTIIIKVNYINLLYLTGLFSFLIICILGLTKIAMVLIGKINNEKFKDIDLNTKSVIYFNNIANNTSFNQYKNRIINYTEDEFLNDIISQIYINSVICNLKFKNYNQGIYLSFIGFIGFIIFFIAGTIWII